MEVISSERLIENAAKMGKVAMKRLDEMKEKYEIVGDVRGKGLFIGIELVKSKKGKERGVAEAEAVVKESFKNGLIMITAGRNTLRVAPPLNIARGELEEGLDTIETALAKVNAA